MPPDSSLDRPRISLLGTTALLFEAPGAFDLSTQQRIWALAREAESWPDIKESVPGITNLMLTFATPPRTTSYLRATLLDAWERAGELSIQGRLVELPVTYGGEFGPSLSAVAVHAGLSIEAVVEIHSAPDYTVFALGSHPGYCYLGGMDPRIAMPRRKTPLVRAESGLVSIGGEQTGVSASAGPSGWNPIGRAAYPFFDASHEPPAALGPGDIIRFRIERILR